MGPVIGPGPLVEGGAGGGDSRVELALGRLPDGADELTVDRRDEVEAGSFAGGEPAGGVDPEVGVDERGQCLFAGVGHISLPSRTRCASPARARGAAAPRRAAADG